MSQTDEQPPRSYAAFGDAFRAHLARGQLRYARCSVCAEPLGYCVRRCRDGHAGVNWVVASGGARLAALTVYQQSYSAAFPVPYAVGELELDEGPRLVAPVAPDAKPLRVGMRMMARVDGAGRLLFVPA